VPRGFQHRLVILERQMLSQQRDVRERQRALSNHFEDRWKLPSRTRGLDAVIRGVLGEMQHLVAIHEERRT